MVMAKLTVLILGLAQASKLNFDMTAAKQRPTTKVVELLKGMEEQLESEAKSDENTYDKFKCWCRKNEDAKEKAIKENTANVKSMEDRVKILISKAARLKAEIEHAEDELAANTAALDTATALRKDQNLEFEDDKQRLSADIEAVTSAMVAMGSGSFLQGTTASTVKSSIQKIISTHSHSLSDEDRDAMESFLQEGSAGPSDAVLGIMTGLKDEFTATLKTAESDEAKQKEQYKELATAKSDEIEAGEEQIEKKTQQRADANQERARKKQEIIDTKKIIVSDGAFVDDLKVKCADMDEQWAERSKTRAEETKAISKAIQTLDAEDAHAAFHSTQTASFLQQSATQNSRAKLASKLLSKAGKADARLTTLALQVKLDNFVKIKKAMDEMVVALKKEQQDEVEQRDFCMKAFRDNEASTAKEKRSKSELEGKEATIASNIEAMNTDLGKLNDELKELQYQERLASQNREEENKEFQTTITEQRQAQVLLKKALEVLKGFYNKEALMQVRAHGEEDPEAPAGFKDYHNSKQSGGVMSMIQTIISETAANEQEAEREEKSAQEDYESFAQETKKSIEDTQAAISDKKDDLAQSEKKQVMTRKTREGVEGELQSLANTKAELHDNCDFLMENFDTRQVARQEEMDSIAKAKQILSGAKFSELQLSSDELKAVGLQ